MRTALSQVKKQKIKKSDLMTINGGVYDIDEKLLLFNYFFDPRHYFIENIFREKGRLCVPEKRVDAFVSGGPDMSTHGKIAWNIVAIPGYADELTRPQRPDSGTIFRHDLPRKADQLPVADGDRLQIYRHAGRHLVTRIIP